LRSDHPIRTADAPLVVLEVRLPLQLTNHRHVRF
jgi:hypothetical protein